MSRSSPLLGVALVIGASTCFAVMDTTVRYASAFFGIAIVLWMRYAVHAAVMTVWIAIARDKSFRTANPMSQIARGALLAFASAMAFAALRRMPVAEFTAIVMLTPLIATLMARFGLGERVSRLRWILVLLGFTGALIMALGKAPASTLMPFLYTQLAAAALAGWIAFGDAPDGWGWIGMALIGAAGATSAWLNVREAAARERPLTPVAASTLNE